MKHIHRQVLEYVRSGKKTVLATVTRSSGSTPQKPGSSALFGRDGLLAGTVGGGLLEGQVQSIAAKALLSCISGQYVFSLDSSQGKEGALCGGETTVLIDAKPDAFIEVFEEMERSVSRRTGGILMTVFQDGDRTGESIRRSWIGQGDRLTIPGDIGPQARDAAEEWFKKQPGKEFHEIILPRAHKEDRKWIYLERIQPLPRLIIAGAGHVGRALAHMGSLLDFEITVVDDRKEFASREQIPDADHLLVRDIGQAMRDIPMGDDTYVVIVTRGHEQDAEALKPCIGSDAAYVGMIGSRHKVAAMRKQFLDNGWATPEQWDAIHAPIGMEIRSRTVQEIAVSIAAQLIHERNHPHEDHTA